uniref:TOBE domain-containing protein n=1 Tax=Pseudophaeobacter arcticus TaxID=385492 RepID=UPI00249132F6
VTHDQTEALTFADQVVVMQDGEVVQIGTPVELFDRPAHTFVGHFIGSPGMNILPCTLQAGAARFADQTIALEGPIRGKPQGKTEVGIRPEFVSLADTGLPATVTKVSDVGRHTVVECQASGTRINAVIEGAGPATGTPVHLDFRRDQTRLYVDGWLASTPDTPDTAAEAAQ